MAAIDLILHPFAQAYPVAEAYWPSHDQLLQLTYQHLLGNANNTFWPRRYW